MKITILAPGSRGDVQPYLALGKGLQNAGHAVYFLASHDFQGLVSEHGLAFINLGGNMQNLAQGMQSLLEKGNMLKILVSMRGAARQMAAQVASSGMSACRDSDLVVSGLGGLFVGYALAEKFGLTFLPAYLYPFTPTRAFPSVLTPLPSFRLASRANRLTHYLAQQMIWQTTRGADNHARKKVLSLPPAPIWGPFAAMQRKKQATLYGFSPQVIAQPGDWEEHLHITGYWFLEPPEGWQPPGDLVRFLEAGSPPVYIGFGSIPNRDPVKTMEMVLQALRRTGQRGIVSAGWGGLQARELPENIFMVGSIPHSWLFPHMAAVVHHGGAGTAAAGFRAGVPSIAMPIFGDQPFWGQRAYALGVGPKPIPWRKMTVDRLAHAIHTAVSDTAMKTLADRLGVRIRAEDGVANALETINHL